MYLLGFMAFTAPPFPACINSQPRQSKNRRSFIGLGQYFSDQVCPLTQTLKMGNISLLLQTGHVCDFYLESSTLN